MKINHQSIIYRVASVDLIVSLPSLSIMYQLKTLTLSAYTHTATFLFHYMLSMLNNDSFNTVVDSIILNLKKIINCLPNRIYIALIIQSTRFLISPYCCTEDVTIYLIISKFKIWKQFGQISCVALNID